MIEINPTSLYVPPSPPSPPIPNPKYAHLATKTPEFIAAEPALEALYDKYWSLPDLPSFRHAAPTADALMPPGAPDRYAAVRTALRHFTARDGARIEVKVYKSPEVRGGATLVYRMHGGGFCVGNHETDGAENVYAAMNPDIVVVSVDYRLAPEHPFPIPVEDSFDGLLWCKANADSLGIDPEKIILAGSSAGANLAASLSLLARDAHLTGILAQILHFPSLCHPKFFPASKYEFGSYHQNASNVVLSVGRFEAFLRAYIPNPEVDERHSPLLAGSLEGLPPALIQAAGVDIFRDMSLAYAEALQAAGVAVDVHAYGGLPHCFPALIPTSPSTPVFYDRYNAFLRKYASSSTVSSST